MKTLTLILSVLVVVSNAAHAVGETEAKLGALASPTEITIRTESYPRPPYSGATYYFYESGNQPICTKLEVCNKFAECAIDYKKGKYKERDDTSPFETTQAVVILREKYSKHRCLTKFGLFK